MPSRVPAPEALLGAPFRTRDHASLGLERSRLRSRDVAHPFTSVNVFGQEETDLVSRCSAYSLLLRPGQAFCGLTAAALWGAQLPPRPSEIHVVELGADRRPRGRGVHGHRSAAERTRVEHLEGLPVVSAADSWVQIAADLEPYDLIAVGDRFVTGLRVRGGRADPVSTLGLLGAAIDRHRGGRGTAAARTALPLVRVGPDSRMETHLRRALVDHSLPEPVVGHRVLVAPRVEVEPDLAYVRERVALEYEGSDHRTDPRAWRRDIQRRELVEAAGWRVIRVVSDDLFPDADALAERVARILAARRCA